MRFEKLTEEVKEEVKRALREYKKMKNREGIKIDE